MYSTLQFPLLRQTCYRKIISKKGNKGFFHKKLMKHTIKLMSSISEIGMKNGIYGNTSLKKA